MESSRGGCTVLNLFNDTLFIFRIGYVPKRFAQNPIKGYKFMNQLQPQHIAIAVLPFQNMSGDATFEYFSDGITEEILNALAGIEQLKVTSKTSSFYFKKKAVPIRQIAEELKVNTILEGSVRLAGNTVRITAQLIHAEEDFHFWSATWDRVLDNIFEVQDEISLLIADKLREQYGHLEIQDHLVAKTTENRKAYEYFLKARFHFNKWNPVDATKAIEWYEKALSLDPNHVDSNVGLSDAYSFFAVTELMPGEETWGKSRYYMNKAYELDPENAGVHYQLANYAFFYHADYPQALEHALRSVELKQNYPEVQQFMAFLYLLAGDTAKAKQHLDLAYSVDPLSQETLFYRAYYEYRSGNYPVAIALYDENLQENPYNIPAYVSRSHALLKQQKYDEAIAFIQKMPKEIVVETEQLGTLCLAYILKNDAENANRYLGALQQAAENPVSFQAHSYLYLAYASLQQNNKAFDWLEKALKLNSSVLLLTFDDPLAFTLRNDSRFATFHQRLYQAKKLISRPTPAKAPLLDENSANAYLEKLTNFIDTEEPFLIPNLSLRSLADLLEIHPNKLSWILNERLGRNFNKYINHFRIEYFKKLALDPANSHISLIGLAYESGFNSKTVFNTYFKKETGLTPKAFLKEQGE